MNNSWSHTKLSDFEKCKKFFWLKYVEKIPEPERLLPPGKTEHANERGTRIHQNCEDFVSGVADDLAPEADKHFGPQLDLLRAMHKDGLVSLEGNWGMSKEWLPTEWKTAWLRMKLDAAVFHDKTRATIIDYKTGRKFGNEVKHNEQLRLYQLATFDRYPELEVVHAELWYLDQNEVTSQTYTRAQGLRFRQDFHRRGLRITDCTDFPANPNIHSCKWCQYGPWNGGQCQVGVK
jgi:PD-(D/E)XK nuclease superfamily